MSRSNLSHSKDANHNEVKQSAIDAGWQCEDTHNCGGVLLDFICNRDGVTVLVEVKSRFGRLTEREKKVFDEWRGEKVLAFTGPQCVAELAEIAHRYICIDRKDDGIPF